MADKKNSENTIKSSPESEQPMPLNELESLREIVFGVAKNQLEQRIHELEQRTENNFAKMQQSLDKHVQDLQSAMQEGFNKLEDKLALADQGQDEKVTQLNTYADKLSSELEMAETNNKQENDELHERLDQEIKALTAKFTDQLDQALDKLNQVSHSLNSTKTDRKTLAKLLATVASNLETDEGE